MMKEIETIWELVNSIDSSKNNPTALNAIEGDVWVHYSTKQLVFDAKRLAFMLLKRGLKKGEKVGILAQPSPFWTIADLAIALAGGISVPLFGNISSENFVYEVALANVRFLFAEGETQWKLYLEHQNLFELVIAMDGREGADILSLYSALSEGEKHWDAHPNLLKEIGESSSPDDLLTILYTSGSSGMPKGVMLSHRNLLHLTNPPDLQWDQKKDLYLSILPLAHVFGRQLNFVMLRWGVSIYYLNDFSLFTKVCGELSPTLMIVVPRVLDKMYGALMAQAVSDRHRIRQKFMQWALSLAIRENQNWFQQSILHPIADYLVYRKIRKKIGERWRIIISGGAALNPMINRFFIRIGLPIYEGWGLSECSTTTLNRPGLNKIGTVGFSLPKIEVKVGKDNELLIRGPTVMLGYYRNQDETHKIIDEDGWLHTGDQGSIDEDGYVKITGRVKQQFKLSTGEYLSPLRIERILCQSPLIESAVVVGEKKKYAAALLFADPIVSEKMRKEHNLTHLSSKEFVESAPVQKELREAVDLVNARVNQWEQVVKYRLILQPLTVEGGELTPTLKIRRKVVLEKYAALIEEMYE